MRVGTYIKGRERGGERERGKERGREGGREGGRDIHVFHCPHFTHDQYFTCCLVALLSTG